MKVTVKVYEDSCGELRHINSERDLYKGKGWAFHKLYRMVEK